jgi:hypothetical protein
MPSGQLVGRRRATKIGDASFFSVLLSSQGGLLAPGVLRGDEICVGILPE